LEYSAAKDAAFCFPCRLFASSSSYARGGGVPRDTPDEAYISKGFNSWKKALEKKKGFPKHEETFCHRHAVEAYRKFMQEKPLPQQVDEHHDRVMTAKQVAVVRNRTTVGHLFSLVRLLARLNLPFRGHDEGWNLATGVFSAR